MAEATSDWKETVIAKLMSIFDKDAETLTRILFYLNEEDKAYKDRGDSIPPDWNTLKLTLSHDDVFKKYAERLAHEDTKKVEKDETLKMAEANCDWKTSVREKLINIFGKDVETLTRILFYLDEEDKVSNDQDDTISPVWKTLKLTASKDDVFKKYAEGLAEDTKKAEKDETFRSTMNLLYSQMVEPLEEPSPDDIGQHFDVNRIGDFDVGQKSAFIGLYRAWNMMPRTTQASIMEAIPKIITNKQLITYVDDVVGLVQRVGDSIVTVGLAALYLSYDAIVNMRRWWNGEISGKRCAKNIIDSFVTFTAGVAGGTGGAVIGSLFGPVGTVIGGIVGGIASSATMNAMSDRMTQSLFSIPKSEALENAYRHLGVPMTAPNNEINSAYHKLCLKHHPDKRGSAEEFYILQLQMATIKASKGEL